MQRVGNAYYVQTPNFWFPVDPHYGRPFIHWLPDPLRIALYQRMNIGYAKRTDFGGALLRTDYTKMLSAGMMRELFKDGKLERERVGFLTKSVIAIREFETTL
jgi:hypothetical protein